MLHSWSRLTLCCECFSTVIAYNRRIHPVLLQRAHLGEKKVGPGAVRMRWVWAVSLGAILPRLRITRSPVIWKVKSWPGGVSSRPVLSASGDILYFGSENGELAAVRTSDGSRLWTYLARGFLQSSPTLSPDGGRLYVGSNGWQLHAVNTTDGSRIWVFDADGVIRGSPALDARHGRVYVGSWLGTFYAINTTDGSVLWTHYTKSYTEKAIQLSAAVTPDGLRVLVGCDNGFLYAFNASTGDELWKKKVAGSFRQSSPVLSPSGEVAYVAPGAALTALNVTDGSALWSSSEAGGHVSRWVTVAGSGGQDLYVGSGDSKVYRVKASDGSVVWAFATGYHVTAAPVPDHAGLTVFVGSFDHSFYALDAANGSLRWSYRTGAGIWSTAAVSPRDSAVYFGSGDTFVYALDARGPTTDWRPDTVGR